MSTLGARRTLTALVAVVGVLVAVGAGLAIRGLGDEGDDPSGGSHRASGGEARATASKDALEAEIAGLKTFVEERRGLRSKAPVKTTLLDEAAFRARVLEEVTEESEEEVKRYGQLFRALRLIEPGTDLLAQLRTLAGEGIVGFYEPETSELLVRGATLTPYVRQILVHELVHALQHQHFDIHRPELDEVHDSEVGFGFESLVEGDASRIEQLYRDSLPNEERLAAARQENDEEQKAEDKLKDVPEAVAELFGLSHGAGPDLVTAILSAGGQSRLDQAFAAPPTTAEQVLHPEKYLAGETARPVAEPRADGEVFDRGVMGEAGFALVLSRLLSQERAFEAARGWGGDRYVAWKAGESVCVRVAVVSDDQRELAELRDALRSWVAQHGAAAVESASPLTARACG